MMMIHSDDQVSCLGLLQGKSVACLWWDSELDGKENDFCHGTFRILLVLWLFKRQVFPASYSVCLYMPQCIVHLASALGENLSLMLHILALTRRERKLTRLLFSLCAVVFSLVWLMRSIQTRLPWLLTPPTSGFPVYTMTTACMCGMSKTRRKWARCTPLCTTLPACGILRYVVCRHKFWIASCSWGSHLNSCQIWIQALTAERKNWLRFRPVVSVVATGLELELGTVLWLHSNGWPNALDAVCCWKKNLTIEKWEVGEGAEPDKAERRGSFHKMYKSLLLTSNKIIWGLWWASAPKSKEWNKW